ncbi:VWA domain-containing protein [Ensifer adhaerens]|uniref:vWA domain-containing protein n=1 Tax=Ensifer adhaerens TaxID=106592 RepID=UPI001CBA711C|nr:VWA domain-containing protein [Ensifer adhaerens]MBZ7922057.1 VWA domain-containing protein [Ensifer adhaerens]UAX94446.1 VWA domain-containing protein [Ensifer adhaerens]UAY02081.1 VWA domain-containing protein [Ensifer adhaerens]UAY09464.1 VWA domain-containing protein [Ensifer adhaerens]
MSDDFDKLGRLDAPKASAEARARALALAMQAFDANEENSTATQGSVRPVRQSSIFNRIWSPIMNRKLLAGSALATLLVVPAAAFLTLELTRNGAPFGESAREIALKDQPKQEAEPQAAAKKAAADEFARQREEKTAAAPAAIQAEREAAASAEADAVANRMASDSAAPLSAVGAVQPQMTYLPAPVVQEEMRVAPPENRERFGKAESNPVKSVATDPVSTFSVDVDTASYAFVRRSLMEGQMPERDAVRVEEMVNYFPYDWPRPETAAAPFKATVTLTPTPWNGGTRLMHVAIKGYDVVPAEAPKANLVFLIDVSGSMDEPDKLPLLKGAFRLLVEKLKPEDTVSIVTYAGNAGTVLEPTVVKDKAKILAAIDTLQPGGSTAGAEGIDAAYALAEKAFVKGGVNRIMLATDGDFNVGPSSDDDLKRLIEEKRKSGIFLSVLGFGRGNYNDALMQTIAQNGNGTAAYIDTLAEAQKTLVEEAGSSLFAIAKDVKLQVEFNPTAIAEYRLIGYETRALKREDFNNDKVDAGDIGSGHSVTAIYEVTPKGSPAVLNDDLRYATAEKPAAEATGNSGELAFLKIRYKKPDGDKSELITTPVTEANAVPALAEASEDVRFSVAVAAFGQKLSGVSALADYSYDSVIDLAAAAKGADPFGYRAEFVNLVRLAKGLGGSGK